MMSKITFINVDSPFGTREATYNSVSQERSDDNRSVLHDCCEVCGYLKDCLWLNQSSTL